jgi:hypothetical protein
MITTTRRRIFGRALVAIVGLLGLSVAPASAAGASAGAVTVTDSNGSPAVGGGSATPFALRPPQGAACAGDSSSGGWRVQSFMVSSGISVAGLAFPLDESTGATFRAYLYSDGGTPFRDQNTAVSTGFLTGLPTFDFSVFGTTDVPAGTYTVGYYCTKLGAGDRYWSTQITVVADPADSGPAKLHWTVSAGTPATTTTAAPTTAATTTVAPVTTAATTTSGVATTSVTGSTSVESTVAETSILATGSSEAAGGPSTSVSNQSGGVLGSTGWNSGVLLVLAVALLLGGLAAVRAARRPAGARRP